MIEKEKRIKFISNEDILNKYPGLFTAHSIDDEPIYLENANPKSLKSFRFLLLPAGITAIMSLSKCDLDEMNNIWNIETNKNKESLLLSINERVKDVINSGTNNIKYLVQEVPNNSNYYLRVIPYSDSNSIEVMTSVLDQRYEDMQNQTPLTLI